MRGEWEGVGCGWVVGSEEVLGEFIGSEGVVWFWSRRGGGKAGGVVAGRGLGGSVAVRGLVGSVAVRGRGAVLQ